MTDYYVGYLGFVKSQSKTIFNSTSNIIYHTVKVIGDTLHYLILGNNHFQQHLMEKSYQMMLEKNVYQIIEVIEEITLMGDWGELDDEFKDFLMERFEITKKSEINHLYKTIKYLKQLKSILLRKEGIVENR